MSPIATIESHILLYLSASQKVTHPQSHISMFKAAAKQYHIHGEAQTVKEARSRDRTKIEEFTVPICIFSLYQCSLLKSTGCITSGCW